MTSLFGSLSFNDLNEVFPNPPIREVAFEIRFAPRLRINADIWQLQDRLVESYPNVSTESITQPTGLININVFQSPDTGRLIKISQQNCVVAFTRYARFEDFKEEVTQRIGMLCETFNITSFTRVGLRYINDIVIPSGDPVAVLRYVSPPVDFERMPIDAIQHFVTEFQVRYKDHFVTLRGALLAPRTDSQRVYVLDVDCHSMAIETVEHVPEVLDKYHDAAQRFFLEHVTEDFKKVMRGNR